MKKLRSALLLAAASIALNQAPQIASAQGKGGGKGHAGGGGESRGQGSGKAADKGHGNSGGQGKSEKHDVGGKGKSGESHARNAVVAEKHGNGSSRSNNEVKAVRKEFNRAASVSSMPVAMRRYFADGHAKGRIAAGAVAYAFARGHGSDFRIDQVGTRMRIANRRGDALVDLDDQSAENLGRWRVGVIDDEVRDGAPAFCRSGAGHPVWGRQWCLDKGFGLGSYDDYRWGRTNDVGNIVFPQSGIGSILGTGALSSLLGSSTFNRLALHAVTLGLLEPLTGRWVSQPTGPQMLMVNSGSDPVAELVDTNRDFRIEDLLVALLPWQ